MNKVDLDKTYETWLETNRDKLMQEFLEGFEDFVESKWVDYQNEFGLYDISNEIDEFELADNLNDEIPFGYALSQKITIKEITAQKVVIESPIIIDELGGKIKTYTVMYSEYPLDQMLSQTNLLNQSKEKTFNFTGNETILSMELNLYDGLDPNKLYYVLVMPKDAQ